MYKTFSISEMKIFMFHDVNKLNDEILSKSRYKINGLLDMETFEKKLEYLIQNYHIIKLVDFVNKKYDNYDNKCIITFDDGLLCHYTCVYPILKKLNIPGVFFISGLPLVEKKIITSHKIQFLLYNNDKTFIFNKTINILKKHNYDVELLWNENKISHIKNNTWPSIEVFLTKIFRQLEFKWIIDKLFDQYVLKNITENQFVDMFYMNIEHIKFLYNNGHEIGGHGYYHDIRDNNEENMHKLRLILDENEINTSYYSYPNGNINSEIIKKYNFNIGLTTESRDIIISDSLLKLPRFNCTLIPNNCKVILCGIQQQGIDICKYLINNNIKIYGIITINENLAKKNNASGWVDYSQFCKEYDIPIYYCKTYSLKSETDFIYFNDNKFDILLLGGWQRLLPENILSTLKYGAIGQHGSSELLPRCRGRSPINWSIIENRKRLIWNIFFITPGIDDGDIIDYSIIDINEFDTCDSIYKKISIIVKNMYLKNIPKILNNEVLTRKQHGEITFYSKRTPDDGLIDWNKSVYEIYNLIRAVTKPYPGAFTYDGLSKILIWKAQPFDNNICYHDAKLGEIVEVFDNEFVVNCCDGTLLVTQHEGNNIYVGTVLTSKIIFDN